MGSEVNEISSNQNSRCPLPPHPSGTDFVGSFFMVLSALLGFFWRLKDPPPPRRASDSSSSSYSCDQQMVKFPSVVKCGLESGFSQTALFEI